MSNSELNVRPTPTAWFCGILDVEVRDGAAGVPGLRRVDLQLAKGEREALAVAGDLGRGRVGQVLAPARDRELDQDGRDRGEQQCREPEREGDRAGAAAAAATSAEERDPQQEVGEERDHADEDGDE